MITALEVPTDPSHPAWGPYTWPDKVYEQGFRPHQLSATEEIIDHFNRGADIVILDAPVGVGKSIVGVMVQRLLCPNGRTLYCPDTKQLQTQLADDFGHYAKVLMGRSNYATHDHPELFNQRWNKLSAADCVREKRTLPACSDCRGQSDDVEVSHCLYCHPVSSCKYRIAVSEAEQAGLAILNTSYFLAESNHGMGRFKGVDLAIIDEADVLPNTLMNQVQVYFSKARIAEFDIPFPEKKTVPESWAEWVEKDALPCLTGHMTDVRQQLNRSRDLDLTRKLTWLTDQVGKLRLLQKSLEAGNAVYDGYDQGNIRFQPVSIAPFAPSMLWGHAERFLLMSGSFDPIDEFIDESGITLAEKQYEIVKVPMMFPVERRPIIVKGVTEMTYKNKQIAWPVMAAKVSYILKTRHPNDRVLVHCASYEYTRFLYERLRNIGRPVIVYEDAAGRSDALEQYKMLPGAVLLAPSMDRGVDLPGDLCRAVILTKVPWPNLRDKRVVARKYARGGERWYVAQAVRKMVQGFGRGMRSEDDYCTCLAPGNRVLTADLVWKPIETLTIGEELLAFDETTSRTSPRRWQHSTVQALSVFDADRYRIVLKTGEEILATGDHRWVSKWGQMKDDSWVRTDALKPGHHLSRYAFPWEVLSSYEAGWLSGFFDGEGTLALRTGNRNPTVTAVIVSQLPGPVLERAKIYLDKLGFQTRETFASRKVSDVRNLGVVGGFTEHLRFLGQIRPIRRLNKARGQGFHGRFKAQENVEVVSVEKWDNGPVVALQTSTGTYVSEGFASHNCYILDKSFIDSIWKSHKALLPSWLKEALDWSGAGL